MEYLIGILNDLQALEVGSNHAIIAPMAAATTKDRRTFQLLVNEVENTSLLIAVSTCVVNALSDGSVAILRENALLTYLPPEPRIFHAMSAQLSELELPETTVNDLQDLYARLDLAIKMSKTFAQQPTPRGNGGVHIDVLTEMWRDLCRHASALMSDLRQCTRAGHDQARAAHGRAAEHLLKSASSGQWPCVSRDGDVEVPSWAERRRHERWTVEWSAQLLGDGQHFPIEVFDVSQGGFGVKCTSAHAPGAHVSILLPTGACYDGAVAWVAGSAFGVSLFSPMKLDDAAIAHARLYGTPADRDKL